MTGTGRNRDRKWYREPMVWLVVSIPASAVIMGVVILSLSISSYDGLVADDYYERGLQINRSLERDDRAAHFSLTGEVVLNPDQGTVGVTLQGNPLFRYPEAVNLRLFHATRSGLDRQFVVSRVGAQRYAGSWPELAPGRWYLQLDAGGWRLTGDLHAPSTQTLVRLESPQG